MSTTEDRKALAEAAREALFQAVRDAESAAHDLAGPKCKKEARESYAEAVAAIDRLASLPPEQAAVPAGGRFVTRESAVTALHHLSRHNGPGRFNEAIAILRATPAAEQATPSSLGASPTHTHIETARNMLREFIDLCQVGDVDENTEVFGWGTLILEAKSFLATAFEQPAEALLADFCEASGTYFTETYRPSTKTRHRVSNPIKWDDLLMLIRAARGIEVRSTETEGLGPEGAEPGGEATRPEQGSEQAAVPALTPTGKYDAVLRPFIALMDFELHANSGKGDRPGWLGMDRSTALLEVYYHLAKLQKAVRQDERAAIQEYAADVANMAMMVVDVCGCLAVEDAPTPAAEQAAQPSEPAPTQAEPVAWQGGMNHTELLAAWAAKLPELTPSMTELSAFAIGIEVGASLSITQEQKL